MKELYSILYDHSTYDTGEPFYRWQECAFPFKVKEMVNDMSFRLICRL